MDPAKSVRTRYAKLVLLHPVRSVNHALPSSASGAQKVDAIFFIRGAAPTKRTL
jgi:hypothetical protein